MPVVPIIAAAALGATAFGITSAVSSSRRAEKESERQRQQASQLESEFRAEERNRERSEAGTQARQRQRTRAAAAQGRRSTILTSPVGVVGEAEGERKTLLGL